MVLIKLYQLCLSAGLILVLQNFAYAQSNVDANQRFCLNYKTLLFVKLDDFVSGVKCESFDQYDKLVTNLNSLLEVPVLNVAFFGTREILGANAGNGFSQISLAFAELEFNRAAKAVFIHEFGHLAFNSYMLKHAAAYTGFAKAKVATLEDQRIVLRLFELLDRDEACSSELCQDFLQKNRKAINRAALEEELIQLATVEYDRSIFKILVGPYHELFADVLAAIYFEDPDAVFDSLVQLGAKHDLVLCRRMAEPSGVMYFYHPHCQLSSLRPSLWKKMEKTFGSSQKKREFMASLLALFLDNIEWNENRVRLELFKASDLLDEEAMNRLRNGIELL